MNTKSFLNTYRILNLLLVVAFLAALSGCSSSSNRNQTVNRATPTMTEEKPTATPTPNNPSAAFVGEWETNDPRASSGGFVRWKFGDGTKKDNGYTGKVTDVSTNDDIANYTITEKTVTFEYLPVSSGSSKTYDYKISDEGKTITLQADKPMVLRKGTNNAEIEKAANIISSHQWNLDSAVATKMGLAPDTYIEFDPAQKNDRGYGNTMKFFDGGGVPQNFLAQYVITSKENVIITLPSGQKAGTYKILNDEKILQIDFTDPVESDLFLNRR